MSAETDIYAALAGDAALAALVWKNLSGHHPGRMPAPRHRFHPVPGGEKFYGLDNSLHAERVRMRVVC